MELTHTWPCGAPCARAEVGSCVRADQQRAAQVLIPHPPSPVTHTQEVLGEEWVPTAAGHAVREVGMQQWVCSSGCTAAGLAQPAPRGHAAWPGMVHGVLQCMHGTQPCTTGHCLAAAAHTPCFHVLERSSQQGRWQMMMTAIWIRQVQLSSLPNPCLAAGS